MVKVKVVAVGMDKDLNAYLVLLQGGREMRALPIFTGPFEAGAISLVLEHVQAPRPLVHDLLKSVIDGLAARVERVEIASMKENYYVACIDLVTCAGGHVRIDARPSDAIALALRSSAPIFVADEIMDHSGVLLKMEMLKLGNLTALPPPSLKQEDRSEVEGLQARLRWLIREEAYEAAAELRDFIRQRRQAEPPT